ncbi:rRNA maturation RNase YbeY [Afifella sp. IM 167]|uniref:rRNA maturation RNase YbeY n=1 Tax=Afifella sp. IM 167 TaxID=2033586 RepID=UPI001CC972E5|nr:rRNA maturation RNase YbeY [Afifella sp. IM 167]MBZ8133728.1 rRNA maturation RNase YbeY [Afifella sp. IM 167]
MQRLSIELAREAGDWPPSEELFPLVERAVGAALEEAGWQPAIAGDEKVELSVLLTDDAAIARLNAAWRGKEKPTNVLSWPQPPGPLLGDIVLAEETLRREAEEAGKDFLDHFAHLLVHGSLHLVGFDHQIEAEAEEMETLERQALARLGIADPYREPDMPATRS